MAFVYLLTNRSMPGTVKIGCTARLPEQRATELYTTGVPTPFEVAAYWHADEKRLLKIESDIHALLASFRVQRNREFFKIAPEDAKERISQFLGKYELLEQRRAEDARRATQEALDQAVQTQKYLAAQEAVRLWEQKKEHVWSQSNLEASRAFGKSLDDLNRMEDTPGNLISTLVWGLLWISTLGVVPIILFLLGADPETKTSKNAREVRERYFDVRGGIFKSHRRNHFESRGVPYPFNDDDPV